MLLDFSDCTETGISNLISRCAENHPFLHYFSPTLIADTGRRMHTVINMYIGNLAMADVIIAVFCIPFQFQAALLQRWDLPAFMCKLCPFLQVRKTAISF